MSGSSVQTPRAMREQATDPRPTAIVAAMPEELAPLVRRAHVLWRRRIGPARVHGGTLAGRPVLLASTGDGRQRAERGLAALIEAFPVRRVLVIGISGGLSPGLAEGELLVAGDVRDGENPAPAPDPVWLTVALGLEGVREARVVTAGRIASTPAEKAALRAAVGGEKFPAVLDLESAGFADAAARNGVAYLVLRSVCDPAEEQLPFDLNRCMAEHGGLSRARILRHALLHPAVIGPLLELRRRTERCSRRLADAVERLLGEDAETAAGSPR